MAGDKKPFDLVLLRVTPESQPLYLVLGVRRWPGRENRASDEYYYNEHTCPTNWTDQIVAVISGGDEDPHGFAKFVRRTEPPEGMRADGYFEASHDGPTWTEIFPESKS